MPLGGKVDVAGSTVASQRGSGFYWCLRRFSLGTLAKKCTLGENGDSKLFIGANA